MHNSSLSWQALLAQGFSTASQLLEFLNLPTHLASSEAEKQFKTRVPLGFARLMEPGNRYDPLLLQVLPLDAELQEVTGYTNDPLQEQTYNLKEGLIHKYSGRVLLTLTGACAINCRYCFRRHFPYHDNNPGRAGWESTIEYIAGNPSIHEVILSGGDPLLANNATIALMVERLQALPHLTTLRIHSRLPVVLPERIDEEFLAIMQACRLQKVIVVHSNHPRELDKRVQNACHALKKHQCHLLNQSVLLKGINDDAHILAALSRRLFECEIMPYYLHLLDKVQGAAHFDLPIEKAIEIHKTLLKLLPGYLVPRLAREVAGEKHKTLIKY